MAASPDRVTHGRLEIASPLHRFVAEDLAPGTGVAPDDFWDSLETIVDELAPRIAEQLALRDHLQQQIDEWHIVRRGEPHDAGAYCDFLREIGYLGPETAAVSVSTADVDPEISEVAGPQLVVPLDNARFALNAANARWGSLYDALYGTDVIPGGDGCDNTAGYNPVRGERVVAFARDLLDQHFGLDHGTHHHATAYTVTAGELVVRQGDGERSRLVDPGKLIGFSGPGDSPEMVLLAHNGLHVELRFDPDHPVGRRDMADICDVHIESAVTTIMDCEDSVAAVDVDDKLVVYGNWLGLVQGTLEHTFTRDGEIIDRRLEPDREYEGLDGGSLVLPGRSLMMIRHVGHHILTDLVTLAGEPIPETILDAMVTTLGAKHDLLGQGRFRNSRTGSVYVVKPKLHGADEVALAAELFERVEDALGLERTTMKIGIMDEERRTSLGLGAAIAAVADRVVFINTGFLDRTGDEIHTSMEAGPMVTKGAMKNATWLAAYEDSNVDAGLRCGLRGRAQIGKGMWAVPAAMGAMVRQKVQHPMAGASTAWVPSPTAATLHALHYHQVDVHSRQQDIIGRAPVPLVDQVELPVLADPAALSPEAIQHELDNNCQGILGYVARWVGQGIGCSTVPDVDEVGLMEDRATLRISSQHVANWLHHGMVTEQQVRATMASMAAVVDRQNRHDPRYSPMSPDLEASVPFQAALDLVLEGRVQPNGYTEDILFRRRRELKARLRA